MATKITGKIRKVNTLVSADLSSDDSDDECDKVKQQSHGKKKDSLIKSNKNKNDRITQSHKNTVTFDESVKSEKPIEKKPEGKSQGYFVPPLPNSYYPSRPVSNSEYVYCQFPNQGADVRTGAPIWNRNHFENAPLAPPNPHQPKYFPDFIINHPNLCEVSRGNILENLPSAHHVAKDNDLSRYYSVLELPRAQKTLVALSPEPPKDNRYYLGKPTMVSFPGPYLLRNKQQTYKAPPMEAPYDNPNGQFRFERGVNNGYANVGPPRFENQNRQAVPPNNGNVPRVVNNLPIINPNPQGMKSAYSVYAPGNLNSHSLNNVYVPPTTLYPVRTQMARGVFSENDNRQALNPPHLPHPPPLENQYMGNNVNGTNENPRIVRNCPNGWKANVPNETNVPCNNCNNCNNFSKKNPPEEKPINQPVKVSQCPKSCCPNSQCGQGPYEGNDISMNKPQIPKPANESNSGKTIPNSAPMPDGSNHINLSSIQMEPIKRMLEVLKMTLENQPRSKQNAEVQNNLPEIAREDKTTHTQFIVEDKETQYKPTEGKEGSHNLKETGTQVRYHESKSYMRKCQGVTALHSHFRSRSPTDWKSGATNQPQSTAGEDSKYYIDLGDDKNNSNLEKNNKGYEEIANIIKRENGKDNKEMTDVIFNMIYGKSCHIVVQKGVANGEGKKNALQKNVKKNQGISTTKNQRPSWKDVWARERNKGKDHVSSTMPTLIEHDVFPKNDMHAIRDSIKGNETTSPEMKFIKKQSESHKTASDVDTASNNLENSNCNACNKRNAKVKFVDPMLKNMEKENMFSEKDEIVVDLENEKILECILNNDNRPKGEIVIDVGCVQLPDDSSKSAVQEENLELKDNLRAQESGKISEYMSRTELYEEAILNLIAKQIKKCTSEWKFDVKDEEDDDSEENKRCSPINQIVGKNRYIPNSQESLGEKKRTVTITLPKEDSSNFSNCKSKDDENSENAKPMDLKTENRLITSGDQELNEVYENIKYLFGMLNDGEKYEFISDVMNKITNFYYAETKSSTPQSPKAHSVDMNDNKQSMTNEEENALAQVLRMICYENDMVNFEGLLPQHLTRSKGDEVGECTNGTNSDDPSSTEFSVRDEIVSNYVLLDAPDMIKHMGKSFANKFNDNKQTQPEPKTVSRGVSANL